MQELRKVWKLHTKLLKENRSTGPADNRKVTKASNLKIGQLAFVKDPQKGTFDFFFMSYVLIIELQVFEMIVWLSLPPQMERRRSVTSITSSW